MQLLYAIILGSGRGYRCQSVRVTSLQKCRSDDEELLLLSAAASAATISLVAISCNLTLTVKTITSQVRQHKYYVT